MVELHDVDSGVVVGLAEDVPERGRDPGSSGPRSVGHEGAPTWTFHDCRLVAQLLERPPDRDPRHAIERPELLFARERVSWGQRSSGDLVAEDQVELVVERHAPGHECHAATLARVIVIVL